MLQQDEKYEEPPEQGNKTLEQNAETVSNTVAKGIHANIYKVELGIPMYWIKQQGKSKQ